MADEETKADQPEQQAGQPATDWEARYRAAVEHSREWERKAKANKGAADELAASQAAGKAAEERIAELERLVAEKEAAEARRKVAAKVASEKGVPADLLVGDDEEEMASYADRLIAAFKPKAAPKVAGAGKFADAPADDRAEQRAFVRKLLGKE